MFSQIYDILDWGRKTNSEKILYHELLYSTEMPVLVVNSVAMNIGVHLSFSIMGNFYILIYNWTPQRGFNIVYVYLYLLYL